MTAELTTRPRSTTRIVDVPPREGLVAWRSLLTVAGVPDAEAVGDLAAVMAQRLNGKNVQHPHLSRYYDVERRWYASLAAGGEPDYSVYGDPWYLPDLWGCWLVYSRAYLRELKPGGKLGQVLTDLGDVRTVVDLGCGFGFGTAALAQAFPNAQVYGTNIPGTVQWDAASRVADRYGFKLVSGPDKIPGRADLIFASEYFEHFPDPVAHLRDVCDELNPRALLAANSFCTTSVGHFPKHRTDGELTDGRQTTAAFKAELAKRGLQKVPTKMWNNRPHYYLEQS